MADLTRADIEGLSARLDEVEGYLHLDQKRAEADELQKRSAEPGFWDDADGAGGTMTRLTRLRDDIDRMAGARERLDDVLAAFAHAAA